MTWVVTILINEFQGIFIKILRFSCVLLKRCPATPLILSENYLENTSFLCPASEAEQYKWRIFCY